MASRTARLLQIVDFVKNRNIQV